jgi:hypothetical protein
MNKEQLKKAIAVVRKDATLTKEYVDLLGGACVIGGLAVAVGFDKWALRQVNDDVITCCKDGIRHLRSVLLWSYGLDKWQLRALQRANDREDNLKKRRTALVKLLKTFED